MKIVYFSPNDTTRTVTEAAAAAMEPGGERVDLLKAPLTEDLSVGAEEMLVVGMPVYAGRIPALCLSSLAHLKGHGGPAAAIAVYGNRDYDDALLELTDLLEAQGFRVVGAGAFIAKHSIFPTVAASRPDEKDMEAIAAFGRECQARRSLFSDSHPGQILVKGNRPYKKPGSGSFRPAGDKSCTSCGACAAICPTKSINPAEPTKTNEDTCIACAACIRVCPTGSRAFRGPVYQTARKAFELKCAAYRLPETFYRAEGGGMEQKTLHITPIGVLRKDENGVRVELEQAYTPGLLGLELYSHVHILWWFDRRDNPEDRSRLQVRPPHRETPGLMGVFASRSPSRPNPIALSTGRILNVDKERGILTLDWSDAEDGTPVLDIKPYSSGLDRVMETEEPYWHADWPHTYEEARARKE